MAYNEMTLDNQVATTNPFDLVDGVYWIDAVDTHGNGGPEWYLQKLGQDGSTWITINPTVSFVINDGNNFVFGKNMTSQHLPRGTYRLLLSSGTAAGTYFHIARLGE